MRHPPSYFLILCTVFVILCTGFIISCTGQGQIMFQYLCRLKTNNMQLTVKEILEKEDFSRSNIISLLASEGEHRVLLFKRSAETKEKYIGNKVWFRGLIEFSNICSKDCLYCGIRKGNTNLTRYNLSDDEILFAAKFAWDNHYGSIALQSGEL